MSGGDSGGGCCEKSVFDKAAGVVARFVSGVMVPFLMPLYVVGFAFWGNTIFSLITTAQKWRIAGMVALVAVLIPMFVVWVLYAFRIIKDPGLNNRGERIIPMLATIICYIASAYMLSDVVGAYLLRLMLVAGVGCLSVAFAVTFFWKISLHMVGVGGLLAMLLSINLMGLGDMLNAMVAMIALAGVLASSRLYLGRHTPMQVLCGFLVGFGAAFVVMNYLIA